MNALGLSGTTGDWIAAMVAAIVVLFILEVILSVQNLVLRRKVRRWQSVHRTADLDKVYEETTEKVQLALEELKKLRSQLHDVEARLRMKISTVKVKRFNAFSDTGSDLSYAIALLDDNQSGVVLSSIYGREETRTYAKPVRGGESAYTLSGEEREVIDASSDSVREAVPTTIL